jgi:hypothetical protein
LWKLERKNKNKNEFLWMVWGQRSKNIQKKIKINKVIWD